MTDAPVTTGITLDDFMQMNHVEIMNGEIVRMNAAGALHAIIGGNLFGNLENYLRDHQLGLAFGDGMTFLMHAGQPYLRDSFVPDVSYISRENVPAAWDINNAHPGVPDFAVEIVSPHDKAEDLRNKLDIYLSRGTQEVWLVYPKLRRIEQHWQEKAQQRSMLYTHGPIDTDRLFPGWNITHEDIFYLPEWIRRQAGLSS